MNFFALYDVNRVKTGKTIEYDKKYPMDFIILLFTSVFSTEKHAFTAVF